MIENRDNCNDHLLVWGGLSVLKDGRFVDAPQEDQVLAKSYPLHEEKGPWIDSTRITILSLKSVYEVNEEIRIVHVVESIKPEYELYIMGPKIIYGEYINGELVSEPVPEGVSDPLIPMIYDGAVLKTPAVDYNYNISLYSFETPGEYKIQWDLGNLKSNTLKITVE